MDRTFSREEDIEFDIESGGNSSEEDASNDVDSSCRQSKNVFSWGWSGIQNFDGSNKHESGVESCSSSVKSDDVVDDNLELLVDRDLEGDVQEELYLVKNNLAKQKNKKTNSRKAPKPPRPPNGPSLDAADQKFVKEIAELALKKRARIKKMKAVKNMKASKTSSSSYTGLSAMVVTIFFLLVIILQGIRSGSGAAVGLMASLDPGVASDEGLISVQYPKNFVTNEGDPPGSHYPILQD